MEKVAHTKNYEEENCPPQSILRSMENINEEHN